MKTVFLTGASGNMGQAALKCLLGKCPNYRIKTLVMPTEKDRKIMADYQGEPQVEVIWGDLTSYDDVLKGVTGADYVLHVGGMVSPMADRYPQRTTQVNVGAIRNIIRAIKAQPDPDAVHLAYIGTVAQTGNRMAPLHWGRVGDPIRISVYDNYAVSKTIAEREVIESGLKHWVSLRQTGIAHPGIVGLMDPIMFHNPLNAALEWITVGDAGRLIANVCEEDVPAEFWRRIYNIGGGKGCREVTHHQGRCMMAMVGIKDIRKVFEPNWFATRNFHGQWYEDSDVLEGYLHFRHETMDDFYRQCAKTTPWYARLAGLAPGLVKKQIEKLARSEGGTLHWLEHNEENKIAAFFGSRDAWARIPGWNGFKLETPSETPVRLNHGYDESKPRSAWNLADMQGAARFRGGECLSADMTPGAIHAPLNWRCAFGHEFQASPTLILSAGHWCPDCLPHPWKDDAVAQRSEFFAQVWNADHEPGENRIYSMDPGDEDPPR